jgi:hypothetical protein
VENWFQNNRPKTTQKAKPNKDEHNLLGQWTVRKVVQHTMKDQIDALIADKTYGAQPGSDTYIGVYQKTCSDVVKGLTPAQLEQCEKLAEEWNTTAPNASTQALCVHRVSQFIIALSNMTDRLAHDKFGPVALQFMKQAKKQMGVHIFMMVGYKNEQGQMLRAK